MKYLIRIIFSFSFLLYFINETVAQDKPDSYFYYSFEELLSSGGMNKTAFPRLKISHDEIKNLLQPLAVYPRFAKSKYINKSVNVSTTINKEGIITAIAIEDPKFAMFDTLAIKLVKATSSYWHPATSKDAAIEATVSIPVLFGITLDSNKAVLIYKISMFTSGLVLTQETSNSYPAFYKESNSSFYETKKMREKMHSFDRYILHGVSKDLPSYTSFSGHYGTVRLGFNLSKTGTISEVKLVHPVVTSLNEEAMKDLKASEGHWEPARESGELVDSYVEFDFSYDEYGDYDFVHKVKRGNAYADLLKAQEFMQEKKYEKALPRLKAASQYFIDDILILFQMALIKLNAGDIAEGCNYLSKITGIAIDTSYPSSVKEEDVKALLKETCNEGEN